MHTTNQTAYTYFTSIVPTTLHQFHARVYIQHEDNVGLLHSRILRTREEAHAYATAYKEAREKRDEEYLTSIS